MQGLSLLSLWQYLSPKESRQHLSPQKSLFLRQHISVPKKASFSGSISGTLFLNHIPGNEELYDAAEGLLHCKLWYYVRRMDMKSLQIICWEGTKVHLQDISAFVISVKLCLTTTYVCMCNVCNFMTAIL